MSALASSLLFACQGHTPPPVATSGEHAPPSEVPAVEIAKRPKPIRLVLWLTIDQFRADSLTRYAHHLQAGGLSRLAEQGAYYENANYDHAITETAPGHATLFTGATPATHGIIGNSWLDLATGRETTSVEDAAYPLVGAANTTAPGRSPRRLLVPTIGDALIVATEGRGKVIGVATKDRSAILPAGFAGKAFWLEDNGYATSRYYGEAPPEWVVAHNRAHPVEGLRGAEWKLSLPRESYRRIDSDDHPWEHPPGKLGRVFPHTLDIDGSMSNVLTATPFGDELSVTFALAALEAEKLGQDEHPDLLSVSLSSTDSIGHNFGPESLEAEDNFVRLDRTVKRLLDEVDARVGLDQTLVVLCADHGAVDSPEHLQELRLDGGRTAVRDIRSQAEEAAKKLFGRKDLVSGATIPYVWLDHALVTKLHLSSLEVARAIAEELERDPHVYGAVASFGPLPEEEPYARVRRSIHAGRSGDIYVVMRPYQILVHNPEMSASHGSPWRYDTHVPLIVLGLGVPVGHFGRPVTPRALAPTVAALLGITGPAGATSAPLEEVAQSRFSAGGPPAHRGVPGPIARAPVSAAPQ